MTLISRVSSLVISQSSVPTTVAGGGGLAILSGNVQLSVSVNDTTFVRNSVLISAPIQFSGSVLHLGGAAMLIHQQSSSAGLL